MFNGLPLFPGENEEDQLARIMEVLDVPPTSVLSSAKRGHKFFTHDGSEHLRCRPSRSFLGRVEPIDMDLLDFLNGCLVWSPKDRMTPLQALRHPWINKHRFKSPCNAHSSDVNGSISVNVFNGATIPESVRAAYEDADELLRKMQQVRVRKPMVNAKDDEEHKVKRSSSAQFLLTFASSQQVRISLVYHIITRWQHAARTERSNSKNRRRYSTGHETSRYLVAPYDRHDKLAESNITVYSGPFGDRPTGEQNYREFLNNGKDNFENFNKSPPALILTSADDTEVFRKHRPRRPTNRQRESMLIRVDDSRTRRLSTAFDNVVGSS
ncbi:uncharacterized protein DEA37_0008226 [Paragonimus westermani]|uniref:Uncharacterized protein n=1 Tax=Paragonimus westermani TaxID=34504 RepID=A0A5J4NLP8_9TREM|nr:uncharacterized protein DEA37_0008226 [Paragonimus westermani]